MRSEDLLSTTMSSRIAALSLGTQPTIRFVAVALIASTHLALYAAGLAISPGASWLNFLYYLLPVAVALVSFQKAFRGRPGGRLGLALVAAAVALWMLEDLSHTLTSGHPPAAAEGLRYLGYLALALAIPRFGLSRESRADWHALLDGTVIFVVSATVAWRFLFMPLVADGGGLGDWFPIFGYPFADLGLLVMLLLTFCQRETSESWLPFGLLAGAAVILLGSDVGYLLWSISGALPDRSVLDLGWLAADWLLLSAVFAYRATPNRGESRAWIRSFRSALPYVATITFAAIALLDASSRGGIPVLLGGLAVAIVILRVRQWLTHADNIRFLQQTEYLANHDHLTGFLTHRAWFEQAMLAPGEASSASLAVIDVDHFKTVNDAYGHPAGDLVLGEVATRLQHALPSGRYFGRIGGEEFGVVFLEPVVDVRAEVEAAVASVGSDPILLNDGDAVQVSISAGLANFGVLADPRRRLLATYERADALLYEAKRSGRNRLAA